MRPDRQEPRQERWFRRKSQRDRAPVDGPWTGTKVWSMPPTFDLIAATSISSLNNPAWVPSGSTRGQRPGAPFLMVSALDCSTAGQLSTEGSNWPDADPSRPEAWRADVELLVGGGWCPEELRMWTQDDDDGASLAQAQYRPPDGHSQVIGAFPGQGRPRGTTDRPRGRRKWPKDHCEPARSGSTSGAASWGVGTVLAAPSLAPGSRACRWASRRR